MELDTNLRHVHYYNYKNRENVYKCLKAVTFLILYKFKALEISKKEDSLRQLGWGRAVKGREDKFVFDVEPLSIFTTESL
jgi:hypothetical protein